MNRFEWDEFKDAANAAKHGISFEDAVSVFDGPVLERLDDRRHYGEQRVIAYGQAAGRVLAVVYTWRGASRRLISARRANTSETRAYRKTANEGVEGSES
jgi:hypothetical protein